MKNNVLFIVQRALAGAEDMPPRERADLYDAAASCLQAEAPAEASAARAVSSAIREAEQLQLELLLTLRAGTTEEQAKTLPA